MRFAQGGLEMKGSDEGRDSVGMLWLRDEALRMLDFVSLTAYFHADAVPVAQGQRSVLAKARAVFRRRLF